MAETKQPTAEQVAQGKARAGGQTSTSGQLVDKVSSKAKAAGETVTKGGSGKTGLLGVPVGTEIVVGPATYVAPPISATGQPVLGKPVTKTVRYAAGDGMKYLLSLSNTDRAEVLAKLSEIVGAYPKGQAPTLDFITNALRAGNVAIREADGKALEQVMKYADTIGDSVTISIEKLRSNPTLAQQFFAIKTTVPKAPKLTPEATLNLEITQALNDYLDIPVDKKLAKEFADTVNNIERKRGTYISAAERNQLLLDAIQKKAGEMFRGKQAPDSLMMQRGALGGSYNALRKAYDAYGIPVDDKTVYKQAINSIRSRQALENEVQKISIQAQVSYPALAPYFQQGLTTRDALATYIGIKSNLFGQEEKDINVADLYPVFKGKELMTPQEWEDYLYTTPEYKKSRRYIGQMFNDAKTLIRNFVPGGM
jgi:hypothetical protein